MATILNVDEILENTPDEGVKVEGILFRDGTIRMNQIYAKKVFIDNVAEVTNDNGIYVDDVHCKDGNIRTRYINKLDESGVVIEGLIFKNGSIENYDITSAFEINKVNIPASYQGYVLEQTLLSECQSIKWNVSIKSGSSVQSFEMLTQHNGTETDYTKYGNIGDFIDFEIYTRILNDKLELVINNNVNQIITITFSKINIFK